MGYPAEASHGGAKRASGGGPRSRAARERSTEAATAEGNGPFKNFSFGQPILFLEKGALFASHLPPRQIRGASCALQQSKENSMDRRTTLALGTIALLCLGAALPGGAVAQQPAKTLRQQLVGTWTFVLTEATQPDGSKILPFGPDPKGVNIFTEDGNFVQIQINSAIPKIAADSRVSGTAEENKAVVQGSLAVFGTYTVDEAARILRYKVESSTYPNWAGQQQERKIELLTETEFKNSNQAGSIAGAKTVNVWRRVK
jgi:Lipocalin-like domain